MKIYSLVLVLACIGGLAEVAVVAGQSVVKVVDAQSPYDV